MPPKDLDIKVNMILQKNQAERQVDLLARDIKKKIDPVRKIELETNTANLKFDLDILRKKLSELKKDPVLNEKAIKSADKAVRDLNSRFTESKRKLQNLKNTGDETMSRFRKSVEKSSRAMSDLGAAIVSALSFRQIIRGFNKLADTSDSFQSSFAGFRKTLEATEGEFREIEKGIVNLSKRLPSTTQELSKIAEVGGQMGIAAGDILIFTETVAKLSTAISGVDAETASQQLARVLSLSGESIQNIDELGSSLVQLGNNFKANEGEILNFAERIAGTAGIVGLTSSEILGISAAFVDVGIQAEAGGTAVQKALLKINGAVIDGGEKLQGFAETAGISAQDFRNLWETDAAQAFNLFVNGLGEAGDNAKGILDDLIGTDVRLQRAFLSLANSGDVLTEAISQANEEFSNANALQEEFEKRLNTNESKLRIQTNRWEAYFAAIGGPLAKARVDFGEFGLSFLPKVWSSIQFGFTVLFNSWDETVTNIKRRTVQLQGIFAITGAFVADVFSAFSDNAKILSNNIGVAFSNIPTAIQSAINIGIGAIETFVNAGLLGLKALGDGLRLIPGLANKIPENFGTVSFGRVDISGARSDFQEFKSIQSQYRDVVSEGVTAKLDALDEEDRIGKEALKLSALRLSEQADITQSEATKREAIAKEEGEVLSDIIDENVEDFTDGEEQKSGAAGKTSDAVKKSQKETQDSYDDTIDKQEDVVKSIEDGIEAIDKQRQAYVELKEDAVDSLQEINNELKELDGDEDNSLAERRLEILEEQSDIQKEIKDLQKGDDGQKFAKINELKETQKQLDQELALIQDNVVQGVLDEVEAYDKLNESQKILADNEKKRAELIEEKLVNSAIADGRDIQITEDENGIKALVENEQGELIELENFKVAQKARELLEERDALKTKTELLIQQVADEYQILQEADIDRRTLESQYTDFLEIETDKRISVADDYIKKLRSIQKLQQQTGVNIPSLANNATVQGGNTTQNVEYNTTINANTPGAAQSAVNSVFSYGPQAN